MKNMLCELGFSEHVEREVVSPMRGRTVIDVGANEGGFTVMYLGGGASRVIAVEPGPKHCADMRERFADEPRAVVVQKGLSDYPGTLKGVTFHNTWTLAKPGQFQNRLKLVAPTKEGDAPFDVELTTLDILAVEHDVRDLGYLKIDVDGYEPQVLRGGSRIIERERPPIYIELSYLPHELGESIDGFIQNVYGNLGYVVTTLHGKVATIEQMRACFPWDTSFDVFMMPEEKVRHWPRLA